MQIYSPRILDIIEIALEFYQNAMSETQNKIDIKDFDHKTYHDLQDRIKEVAEIKSDIHQQNNRIKYQELRRD